MAKKAAWINKAKDLSQLAIAIVGLVVVVVGFFGYFINNNRQIDKNFGEMSARISDGEHSQNYMKLSIDQLYKLLERERQERESEQIHMQDSINVRLTRIEDKLDRANANGRL